MTVLWPCRAHADPDTAPATTGSESAREESFSTGLHFFDDSDLKGGLYFFQRERRRFDPAQGNYGVNLSHATATASAEFNSGFAGGIIGCDVGLYGTADLKNAGAPDHEMNFMPWDDPWHPDWSKKDARDGVSFHKAQIKAKAGPFWAQGGYFQPSGPGVLGVNWSVMPGTYRGMNMGAEWGDFSFALAWADAYKAPWFTRMNSFYKNDGESPVPWLWSAGARYNSKGGLTLEAAYGESKNFIWNAHLKGRYETVFGNGKKDSLAFGAHVYLMGDFDHAPSSPNNNFAGTAAQPYMFIHYRRAPWLFMLEGTYTLAPFDSAQQAGYFAYRLTDRYGSSKGAYDPWWDAHTDWNAHREKALFASAGRGLDDLLPVRGLTVTVGAGLGWDGQAYGVSGHFKEWAFTFDLNYTRQEAPLQGAFAKLHLTAYRNGTDFPDWNPYKNGFQSEHDVKFFIGVPFDL